MEPTILRDVPRTSRLFREEVFGPVLIVNTFESEADAVREANDTEFGLFGTSVVLSLCPR